MSQCCPVLLHVKYPSIHILFRVTGNLEPIPGGIGHKAGYTLDRVPIHRRAQSALPDTCRNRCYTPYDYETPGCRCDEQCVNSNSCCYDFADICLQPIESWECTPLRCGEKRVSGSKCHCSSDCVSAGDCCTNYGIVCNGMTPWVQDQCVSMSSPKCPANYKRQPLLLISLDGLRAEYQQTWHSLIPVLDKLRKCGTSSAFMQPVFPSKTFPNHYSIVTVSRRALLYLCSCKSFYQYCLVKYDTAGENNITHFYLALGLLILEIGNR
ncbi:venom phosphodiesterase-like [Ictalurus furcatus]|uniref:venom phosphodiesterase-like n=1 Tax=Ictalurus furcatus TaxID=66913 RepID=UPI00234FC69D|nr:venom phosphodiesterase-like [Ictalurus furcatus]